MFIEYLAKSNPFGRVSGCVSFIAVGSIMRLLFNTKLMNHQIAIQEKPRSVPSKLLMPTPKLFELNAYTFNSFGSCATEAYVSVYVKKTAVGLPAWLLLNIIILVSPLIFAVPYSISLKKLLLFYTKEMVGIKSVSISIPYKYSALLFANVSVK